VGGITIVVNETQTKKKFAPKVVTPLGIERVVRLEQDSNTLLPKEVTLMGILIVFIYVHALKA